MQEIFIETDYLDLNIRYGFATDCHERGTYVGGTVTVKFDSDHNVTEYIEKWGEAPALSRLTGDIVGRLRCGDSARKNGLWTFVLSLEDTAIDLTTVNVRVPRGMAVQVDSHIRFDPAWIESTWLSTSLKCIPLSKVVVSDVRLCTPPTPRVRDDCRTCARHV